MTQLTRDLKTHCNSMQELIKIRYEYLRSVNEQLEQEYARNKQLSARAQILQMRYLASASRQPCDANYALASAWQTLDSMLRQ